MLDQMMNVSVLYTRIADFTCLGLPHNESSVVWPGHPLHCSSSDICTGSDSGHAWIYEKVRQRNDFRRWYVLYVNLTFEMSLHNQRNLELS